MDEIEKLLRKINKKDRQKLEKMVEKLVKGDLFGFRVKKLWNEEGYRVRSGRFRIIFQITHNQILITGIKSRKEKTYK